MWIKYLQLLTGKVLCSLPKKITSILATKSAENGRIVKWKQKKNFWISSF
jgi:hypothetical protein